MSCERIAKDGKGQIMTFLFGKVRNLNFILLTKNKIKRPK